MPELSYREAVRDALAHALREDEHVFLMGEDIAEMGGSMGVTQGLLDEFGPTRIRNTPISEMAIVGSGIGAAMQGMRPVIEIMYEDFLTLAMEQLVNQAAKHRTMSGGQVKVPLTIRTQGGAGWSPGAQHAQQACQPRHSGEAAADGQERQADDDEVENVPRVAEECQRPWPVRNKPECDLDHEDDADRHVQGEEEVAELSHQLL